MRSYSLAGTRPAWMSRSVPRLTAPNRERTCTSPGLGAAMVSSRNSARPGPTYQSALLCMFVTLLLSRILRKMSPRAGVPLHDKTSTRKAFAALDLEACPYILKRPQRPAKPFHARTFFPRRGHHRRAHRPARVAPDAVFPMRRADDDRADLARRGRGP